MARLLRSDYDQLADFSRTFERESNSAKRSLDSLKRQIEVLEGGDWIGKGADAFYREMNSEVLPAVQRLVKALELASRVTGQIARIFQEVEEECSRFFSRTLSDTGDNAADALRAAGAIAMGGLAGLGAQAGAGLGGAGDASDSAPPEQAASGGGGGGSGGGAGGGGGGGGGGGSWNGEIGFKQEKPAPGGSPPPRPGRRRGAG